VWSAQVDDGIHLILQGVRAQPATGSPSRVSVINKCVGVPVFSLAFPADNGAIACTANVDAIVIAASDTGGAVEFILVSYWGPLISGERTCGKKPHDS